MFVCLSPHKGTWSFECQMHGHFIAGMKGFYEVTDCGQFQGEQLNGIERTYYIAAVELEWDYAPVKTGNLMDPSRYGKEPPPGGERILQFVFLGGSNLVKTPRRLGSWFQRYIQWKD